MKQSILLALSFLVIGLKKGWIPRPLSVEGLTRLERITLVPVKEFKETI